LNFSAVFPCADVPSHGRSSFRTVRDLSGTPVLEIVSSEWAWRLRLGPPPLPFAFFVGKIFSHVRRFLGPRLVWLGRSVLFALFFFFRDVGAAFFCFCLDGLGQGGAWFFGLRRLGPFP